MHTIYCIIIIIRTPERVIGRSRPLGWNNLQAVPGGGVEAGGSGPCGCLECGNTERGTSAQRGG